MDLLQEALAWHRLGYAPVPITTDGTKHPAVLWREFIDDPPTPDEVCGFFRIRDTDGVGLICGRASGSLEMIEVEGRAVHLVDDLGALMADNGVGDVWTRLRAGYVERTPSGGIHWYYRVDGPALGNTKLASRLATDDELAVNPAEKRKVLIETRGEGGFTVVAPSGGRSHPSGQPWVVLTGSRENIPKLSVDERDTLHAIARMLDQLPCEPVWDTPGDRNLPHNPSDQLRPGDDYNARATWDEILGSRGWVATKKLGRGIGWTRPGKRPGDGISATTGTSTDGEDRLYVFSSSTEFDTERPYSKFAAFCLLEHAGDFRAAASTLGRAGYGAPREPAPTLTINGAAPTLTLIQGGVTEGATALAPDPADVHPYSEDAHSALLIHHYGSLVRYCPQRSAWLAWDGAVWRWQPKGGGIVREYAKRVARDITLSTAAAQTWKKRCSSKGGVDGCLGCAQTDERVSVDISSLDADPWTLNTPGGLVDLRTGYVSPPDPARLATKTTRVAPDPSPEAAVEWQRFLADTFGGDAGLLGYIQRLAGVTLVGTVREQLLAFLHGLGANGKSTLVEALMYALGVGENGYAIAAPAEMLMIRKHSEHPAELAQLAGARMVVCSELDDGQRFAEAKIKQLTGSDSINARFLYGQPFTFTPSHTFWLLGNQRPQARTGGMAFWRRVKLIEFTNTVPPERRDPALGDKLAAISGVILAWAIQGAVDYCRDGVREPEIVSRATQAYADDQDTVARFVEDQVHLTPSSTLTKVPVSELRSAYERWCDETGETPVTARRLTQELAEKHGVESVKHSGRRFYVGMALITFDDEGSPERPEPGIW